MNKHSLIIGALALSMPMAVMAETLSPEQAIARAQALALAHMPAMQPREAQTQLLFTAYGESMPAAYVFSNGNGYVVLSADDVAAPVLGYSDRGFISEESMPPALKYWLGEYAREIEYARANGAQPAKSAPYANASWTSINPICSTKWDQSTPYNNMCPTEGGRHAVTGCVATAMSQMMKYHNYPPQGKGSNVYSAMNQTISVNFADYTFAWDQMLDNYEGAPATQEQKDAVAALMYCAGVSVDMNYSTASSGAQSWKIPVALINNFSYDKGCHWLKRDYFALSDWQEQIYNEIKTVGPVIYSGITGSKEGHCFICDGYDANGYFHFNWGWGGMSDGYYLLTALTPDAMGIGGASSGQGFNYAQEIVLGGSTTGQGDYYWQMYCNGDFKISQSSVNLGSNVNVSSEVFYNASVTTLKGTIGLNLYKSDGTSVYARGALMDNVPTNNGFREYTCQIPKDLANGTYTVKPAFVNNQSQNFDILVAIGKVASYTMKVSDGKATFTANTPTASVWVNSVDVLTPKLYENKRYKFSLDLTNNGNTEYLDNICGGLYKSGSKPKSGTKPDYIGTEMIVDVEAGQSATYEYISKFGNAGVGSYTLYFMNPKTYEWYSQGTDIAIEAAPSASETTMDIENFQLHDGMTQATDKYNMVFTFDIFCLSGCVDGSLYIGIAEDGKNFFRGGFYTKNILLYEGEAETVTANGGVSTLQVGRTYNAYICTNNKIANALAGPYVFKLVDVDGIEGIESDSTPVSEEYYNLQGIKVQGTLAPGLYICVKHFADGSVKKIKFRK